LSRFITAFWFWNCHFNCT